MAVFRQAFHPMVLHTMFVDDSEHPQALREKRNLFYSGVAVSIIVQLARRMFFNNTIDRIPVDVFCTVGCSVLLLRLHRAARAYF